MGVFDCHEVLLAECTVRVTTLFVHNCSPVIKLFCAVRCELHPSINPKFGSNFAPSFLQLNTGFLEGEIRIDTEAQRIQEKWVTRINGCREFTDRATMTLPVVEVR
jgi:hypothetical protein